MKDGKRNKLGNGKVDKQTMVYGRYQQHKSVLKATSLALAGRLWNNDDLKFFKMDEKCQPLLDTLASMQNGKEKQRVFKAWKES